jgi:hypothetical protein
MRKTLNVLLLFNIICVINRMKYHYVKISSEKSSFMKGNISTFIHSFLAIWGNLFKTNFPLLEIYNSVQMTFTFPPFSK